MQSKIEGHTLVYERRFAKEIPIYVNIRTETTHEIAHMICPGVRALEICASLTKSQQRHEVASTAHPFLYIMYCNFNPLIKPGCFPVL